MGKPPAGARPPSAAPLMASTATIMATGPALLFTLAALSPSILAELPLTAGQIGLLPAMVFGLSVPLGLGLGSMLDRFGPRPFTLVSACLALTGLVLLAGSRSFGQMAAAAVITAVPVALGNPLTNTLIARAGSASPGLVIGVKQAGVQLGQWVVGLTAPPLALLLGWRPAALCIAGLVIAGGIGTSMAERVRRAAHASSPDGGPRSRGTAYSAPPRYASTRDVVPLALHMFVVGVVVQSTNFYLPLYGFDAMGMSAAGAGLIVGVVGAVGATSRIAMGRAADRVGPARVRAWLPASAAGTCAAMVLLGLAPVLGVWTVWVGAVVYGVATLSANVVVMLEVTGASTPQSVGWHTAVVSSSLAAGFCLGPIAFGQSLDGGRTYASLWLVLAALTGTGTVALLWDLRRHVHRFADSPA